MGTDIDILTTYVDHNSFMSPLSGVPDLQDWESIYGKHISGLAVFDIAQAAHLTASYAC
jgi:hypothetical protein